MDAINVVAQIGNMKDIDYRNTLAIASIIEILIEKGIVERNHIARKAKQLDSMSIEEIHSMRKSSLRYGSTDISL